MLVVGKMGQRSSPYFHSLDRHEEFSRRTSRIEQAAKSKPLKGGLKDKDERFRMLCYLHHGFGCWARRGSAKEAASKQRDHT